MSGYYGFGNLGDEAVLAGLLRGLRRAGPDIHVLVLSGNPEKTSRLHGVPAAHRGLAGAWRALGGAQALVSGGGSLLQDATSFRSPLYYLGLMALARLRGVRVIWFAQGIGPVRRAWLRRLVAREARRAWAISVRDEASRRSLAAWGVDPGRIHVVGDPAWELAREARPESGHAGGVGGAAAKERAVGLDSARGGVRVLVVWRSWKGQQAPPRQVGFALGRALSEGLPEGSRVTVMAFQPQQDLQACRELAGAAAEAGCTGGTQWDPPESAPEDPAQALRVLAGFDVVIGVRLHALILAAAAGVPFVGVAYDPKIQGLLEELKWPIPAVAPCEAGEPGVWRARLETVLQDRERLRSSLAGVRTRMEEQADAGVRALVAALARKPGPADERPASYEILGLPVHAVGLDDAVTMVTRWAQDSGGACSLRHVVTLNPEMVMRARHDPELAFAVARAELVVPDGVGVIWAARLLGCPERGRVPGIELAERCLRAVARLGLPVFLVGGTPPGPNGPGVAEEAARRLQARPDLAGLRIAGAHHGYFAFGSDEEERLLCAIEAARPALLLVGMGVPRQEVWIARHRERLGRSVRVAIGVGGSLDVWAGRVRRAPVFLRRLGLEWLFRAATQPWRFKRLVALPAFTGAVLGYRLGGIMGQRARKKA